jgi:hypothetical protein
MHCHSEVLSTKPSQHLCPFLLSLLLIPIPISTTKLKEYYLSPLSIKALFLYYHPINHPPPFSSIPNSYCHGLPLSSNLFAQPTKTSSNRLAKSKSTSPTRFCPACLAASLATPKYQHTISTSNNDITYFHIVSRYKLTLSLRWKLNW